MTDYELDELAEKLVRESVAFKMLRRWVRMVIQAIFEDHIAPRENTIVKLRAEIADLKDELATVSDRLEQAYQALEEQS